MLSTVERLKIEENVIPEVSTLSIKQFVKLHPALHQACCTFTYCTHHTESLINQATEITTFILKGEQAAKYLETLIKLYSASGELEQAAALIRLQHDMNLKSEPQSLRL